MTAKWYAARTTSDSISPEQRQRMANLEAIGYASGVDEGGAVVGITVHDEAASQPGYNFFVSGKVRKPS